MIAKPHYYTDDELFVVIRAQLLAGLSKYGYPDIEVSAKQQPTQQGVVAVQKRAIYLEEIHDHRYGFPTETHYTDGNGNLVEVTTQVVEKTFQVSAFAIHNPKEAASSRLMAIDLAHLAAGLLQRPQWARDMSRLGIGVLRVTTVRNPYIKNDMDRQQALPSFDIIFTFTRKLQTPANVLSGAEARIIPV